MSISSELLTLQNTKTAIRTAINNKGGSVEASAPFASYATAITNLPSGGSGNPLLTSIDVSDFTGTTFNAAVTYITSVTIPSGVTRLNSGAFQNCSSLTSVTIPNSVNTIGSAAFSGCSSLTSVTIPSGVTAIDLNTFAWCSSLTSVTIPSGVTGIYAGAFNNCTSLTKIIVNATTPPTMSNSNSFNSTNNCPIYVPAESVDTYKAASGWSSYASRIYPITQVATVDGNPVYNYDLGMTDMTDISSQQLAAIPSGDVIEICEGISTIWGQFGAYEEITLPSTITVLYDLDSIGPSTTTLTIKSTTPPTVQQDSIGGANLTAIYVPASAVSTYQSNPAFSSFSSIIQAIPS